VHFVTEIVHEPVNIHVVQDAKIRHFLQKAGMTDYVQRFTEIQLTRLRKLNDFEKFPHIENKYDIGFAVSSLVLKNEVFDIISVT